MNQKVKHLKQAIKQLESEKFLHDDVALEWGLPLIMRYTFDIAKEDLEIE